MAMRRKTSFPELRGKKFRAFSFWLMLVQICNGKIYRVFRAGGAGVVKGT
jgi:hypothetical protein